LYPGRNPCIFITIAIHITRKIDLGLAKNELKGMIYLNAVIFDLELVKRFRKGQLSEIVEIGACKVNLDTKQCFDQLQIYMLPKSGVISESTRKFIHMSKEDVEEAIPFEQGIKQFADWLGEDYYLCSWGRDDKIHIVDQCVRNHISLDWFQNYNDIQKPIGKLMGAQKNSQIGLKNALKELGIEVTGKLHRGIDDAINTSELLIQFLDQIELQTNTLTKEEMTQKRLPKRPRKKSLKKLAGPSSSNTIDRNKHKE
jgi:inhibitor of KinA sporulation pathway (predicted exonuclease)